MSMAKPITEFIGTFFLVFTIGMCVIEPGAGAMAPVAIGVVLMTMIYAGGHISGAHFNPAATLALLLRGACPKSDVVPYLVAQFAAGASAAFSVLLMKGDVVVEPLPIDIVPAMLAEVIFTFAVCYVILNVATVKSVAGNSYYGLAIGGSVLAGAYAVGSVSGGSFNPAVTLALGITGLVQWADLWVHLVGEVVGGVCAALVFMVTVKKDT